MKKMILLAVITCFFSATLFAAGLQYHLRVDGLSCPFCAYGIEKKLLKSKGVKSVSIDLEKGLVIVSVVSGATLSGAQLKQRVNDAGFTLRSVKELPQ